MKTEKSRLKLASRNGSNLYQSTHPNQVVMAFTDKATAFEGNMLAKTIAGKAVINSLISQRLMSLLNSMGFATHFQKRLNMQEHAVTPCDPIPISLVVHNYAAGEFAAGLGVETGIALPEPIVEFRHHLSADSFTIVPEQLITAFDWADPEEVEDMLAIANRVNDIVSGYFHAFHFTLAELHLHFGRHQTFIDDGEFEVEESELMLIDQLSADTCRLWDQLDNNRPTGKEAALVADNLDGYQQLVDRLGLMPGRIGGQNS